MTKRTAISNKIMIIGIDGMDPALTRKYIAEGKMPHTKRILEKGVSGKDLFMLGGMPTCTPPMWTSIATGTWPYVHGLVDFSRHPEEAPFSLGYGMNSEFVTAEQIWNVTAEAGHKTLVWHWPVAWPPTSDSPNLHVVDGTTPSYVNMGVAQREEEMICFASYEISTVKFSPKAAKDSNIQCVITNLNESDISANSKKNVDIFAEFQNVDEFSKNSKNKIARLVMSNEEGLSSLSNRPFNVSMSPITDAKGWIIAPENAKEFTMLLSGGLIRRVCLILQNEQGIYDKVAIYKNKKTTEPIVVLSNNVYTTDVIDDCIDKEQNYTVTRDMRLLEVAEDGSKIRIWVSAAMDTQNDMVWHPKSLYKKVVENVGYCPPDCNIGNTDKQLMYDCMLASWDRGAEWTANAINYLIQEEKYTMVFTQFHNLDALGHMFLHYLIERNDGRLNPQIYHDIMEYGYIQTDNYIAKFEHFIDEGWTLLFLSDHAQVCSQHHADALNDGTGIFIPGMKELGFTVLKKDENGNELREIDWSKTKAVLNGGGHIYLNLKSRHPEGIIKPEERYAVEEEIITALYGYRHPETGKRVISLALRNKDAIVIGQGGPHAGDIIILTAEGYTGDHGDGLPTVQGEAGTSVAPIFFAAGKGLKKGVEISRTIRQIDIAPTVAVLAGLRMPADCEGAPIYQIFEEEF